jgi:hypothetical protein
LKIDDINFVGYFAHSLTEHKRLEGMITIEYRHHIPLEQNLHVVLLLAMHMGNDIPTGDPLEAIAVRISPWVFMTGNSRDGR